jgi:SAM-dependent methyltransferase
MTGNSAPPERVSEMFDRISGVYDGMNLLISGFQEPRWRRRAVAETKLGPGHRGLDVACGTGTVTRDLLRAVQPGGSVTGVDASAGMVARARTHDGDAGSALRRVGSVCGVVSVAQATVSDQDGDGQRRRADEQQGGDEAARQQTVDQLGPAQRAATPAVTVAAVGVKRPGRRGMLLQQRFGIFEEQSARNEQGGGVAEHGGLG